MTTLKSRNYNFSDEELFQRNIDLVYLMNRDSVKFTAFGIDQTEREAHAAKVETFKKIGYDLKVLNDQKQASFDKNKTGNELRTKIFDLQLKSDLALRKGAVDFQLVDLGGVSLYDLDELRNIAEVYTELLEGYSETLVNFGINEADFTELKALSETFSANMLNQRIAKKQRKIAAQERVVLANSLYSDFSTYCNLGRQMWAAIDPVKSSDYVIYSATSSNTEPDDTGGRAEVIPDQPAFS